MTISPSHNAAQVILSLSPAPTPNLPSPLSSSHIPYPATEIIFLKHNYFLSFILCLEQNLNFLVCVLVE